MRLFEFQTFSPVTPLEADIWLYGGLAAIVSGVVLTIILLVRSLKNKSDN